MRVPGALAEPWPPCRYAMSHHGCCRRRVRAKRGEAHCSAGPGRPQPGSVEAAQALAFAGWALVPARWPLARMILDISAAKRPARIYSPILIAWKWMEGHFCLLAAGLPDVSIFSRGRSVWPEEVDNKCVQMLEHLLYGRGRRHSGVIRVVRRRRTQCLSRPVMR
jgi:hypothetical protein